MEKYKPQTIFNVPVENIINYKKECDRRKVLENKDNFIFDGKFITYII